MIFGVQPNFFFPQANAQPGAQAENDLKRARQGSSVEIALRASALDEAGREAVLAMIGHLARIEADRKAKEGGL